MRIHQYATQGDCEGVRKELRSGVLVDVRDERDYTPLSCAANSPKSHRDMLLLLIESGANVDAIVDELKRTVDVLKSLNQFDEANLPMSEWRRTPLELAASSGDLEKVRILLDAGADPNLVLTNGYTAMFSAVSASSKDENLIPMLEVFVKHGAKSDWTANDTESPLTAASEIGRFDAVKYLIEAGADSASLEWTPLMAAIAMGSSKNVEVLLRDTSQVDQKDRFRRTPLHLAAFVGDVQKAGLLRAVGCDIDALDRSGDTPLMIAASHGKTAMLRWLIDNGADTQSRGRMGETALDKSVAGGHVETARLLIEVGADVDSADDSGNTPIVVAAQAGCTEAVQLLLEAGVDPNHKNAFNENAMSSATNEAVIRELVKAGGDFGDISKEMKRELTRMDGVETLNISKVQYLSDRYPRFGRSNPEEMDIPFWREMVRSGINAYQAKVQFDDETYSNGPVWCFDRFGTSFTELPDGRFVQIGGEHEDYYDPDFCIYNDVVVHEPSGQFVILGYPEVSFPPTDFHSATVVNGEIFIVGRAGYHGTREFGTTPVYRLNCRTWKIEAVKCRGDHPGWIYEHKARFDGSNGLIVSGGKICRLVEGEEQHVQNEGTFRLNLSDMTWTQTSCENSLPKLPPCSA